MRLVTALICLVLIVLAVQSHNGSTPLSPAPVLGDAAVLQARYAAWAGSTHADELVVPLGSPEAHGSASVRATARINPTTGDFSVTSMRGLASPVSVWLVDNVEGDGRSARPEPGDRFIRLGTATGGWFRDRLDPSELDDFDVDVIALTALGDTPVEGSLAVGSPTLFQRMRAQSRSKSALSAGPAMLSLFSARGPMDLAELVAEGERLFTQERFSGNGRTCATCHRPENNFTIDPDFIASLPLEDPLFVAETNPALNSEMNGGLVFEHPQMMREFGLIVANVDGTEDLASKFTLRGVPHVLGMSQSLMADETDGTTVPPSQRTGWSGDGAPGSGSLRDFAIGAVIQHYPRTLARRPGSDFRLPNDRELDALEAFQLSLGRQSELDLTSFSFADPEAEAGLELFVGPARCNGCHLNGGANFVLNPDANRNFDTGVENFRRPTLASGESTPADGGFGRSPRRDGGFGDGTFNTPSVIESADTAPYFHNNSAATLEEAIQFYDTRAFNNSPGGVQTGGIRLNGQEIRQLARFLRVLNALDNIREAEDLLTRLDRQDRRRAAGLLNQVLEEIDDAASVGSIRTGRATPGAAATQSALTSAEEAIVRALSANAFDNLTGRDAAVRRAADNLRQARAGFLRGGDAVAVGPQTPGNGDGRRDGGPGGRGPGNGAGQAGGGQGGAGQAGGGPGNGGRGPGGAIPGGQTPPPPGTGMPALSESTNEGIQTANVSSAPELATGFDLDVNYPNPFNPTTTIPFELTETAPVRLAVYDVLGQEVAVLVDGIRGAGRYSAAWDSRDASGRSVPSGTYLYRLSVGGRQLTRTMLLIK